MSAGKGWLALKWTGLQFCEMQVLFHSKLQILAFHYFVKDTSTAVLVFNDPLLIEITNPSGLKPKYIQGYS